MDIPLATAAQEAAGAPIMHIAFSSPYAAWVALVGALVGATIGPWVADTFNKITSLRRAREQSLSMIAMHDFQNKHVTEAFADAFCAMPLMWEEHKAVADFARTSLYHEFCRNPVDNMVIKSRHETLVREMCRVLKKDPAPWLMSYWPHGLYLEREAYHAALVSLPKMVQKQEQLIEMMKSTPPFNTGKGDDE
jgi:hypothetical protein